MYLAEFARGLGATVEWAELCTQQRGRPPDRLADDISATPTETHPLPQRLPENDLAKHQGLQRVPELERGSQLLLSLKAIGALILRLGWRAWFGPDLRQAGATSQAIRVLMASCSNNSANPGGNASNGAHWSRPMIPTHSPSHRSLLSGWTDK